MAEGEGGDREGKQSATWQKKSYMYQDEHASIHVVNVHSIHVVNVHNTYKHIYIYRGYGGERAFKYSGTA